MIGPVTRIGGWLAGWRTPTTVRLPILSYHRVAPTGAPALAPWRVTPSAFEKHLQYLRSAGYRSVTLDQWRGGAGSGWRFPRFPILMTFDDGYIDFQEYAWPLLRRYGFSALVFLVAGEIGGSNTWDHAAGEQVPLLDWPAIQQLQRQGVAFGSHSISHPRLTTVTHEQVTEEGRRSKAALERGLGRPVETFAYPYGDVDPEVVRLIGGCGYRFGLTCRVSPASRTDPPLELPRIEVGGSDSVADLERKLLA